MRRDGPGRRDGGRPAFEEPGAARVTVRGRDLALDTILAVDRTVVMRESVGEYLARHAGPDHEEIRGRSVLLVEVGPLPSRSFLDRGGTPGHPSSRASARIRSRSRPGTRSKWRTLPVTSVSPW